MNRLTDEQVAHEVSMIEDESQWPNWPWLPVKNINRYDSDCNFADENNGLGMLLSPAWVIGAEIQVLFINMLDLGKALEELNTSAIPHRNFESVEAMVRAGWIGD